MRLQRLQLVNLVQEINHSRRQVKGSCKELPHDSQGDRTIVGENRFFSPAHTLFNNPRGHLLRTQNIRERRAMYYESCSITKITFMAMW